MYRKHLRATQLQASNMNSTSKSQFIQHLASYSGVFIAWNIAAKTYSVLKSSHHVLDSSFGAVEKATFLVADKAEPLFKLLEPQLKVADSMALRGVINLEEMIAYLKKQSELAKDVSDVGREHSSEFFSSASGESILMALNTVFDAYEMYLDILLPPLGDGFPDRAFGDRARPPVFQRADALTERFKERLYKHSLLYLQNLRLRGKITLTKYYQSKNASLEHAHA